MEKNKNSISRKDALKTMGGLSFGLPFLPSMLGHLSAEEKKEKKPISKGKKIKGTTQYPLDHNGRCSAKCFKLLWKQDYANT